MNQLIPFFAALIFTFHLNPLTSNILFAENPLENAKRFITEHEQLIRPLEKTANLAWWEANTIGSEEAYKKKEHAQNELDKVLSNPERFNQLKDIKHSTQILSSIPTEIHRQINLLYFQYLEKQLDSELLQNMVAKANTIEKAFNNYRAKIDGKELSDSEIRKILKESTDSELRKKTWLASKSVGALVENDLKELVGLRNLAAQKLGFKNYHQMQLQLNEQTPEEVLNLFDELDALTAPIFLKAKTEIDEILAAKYQNKITELMPWHYLDPFFQESPAIFSINLDSIYEKADLLKLVKDYYQGIGLPIDAVLKKSDLYEKKGKSPHAFCTDIDREGDVRVLANIVPTEYWAGTILHELGHAVYSSQNIPKTLPYLLRTESHILTTEGIAMLFGAFSKSPEWIKGMGLAFPKTPPKAPNGAETLKKIRRNELLVFSRWAQVMFRFEMALYQNPKQDLNDLWWTLVEKYQNIKRPKGRSEPDYGAKIHIVSAPAYYHNYLMGELFAAQVYSHVFTSVLKSKPTKSAFIGEKAVGKYFKEKVFAPGKSLSWNDLTKFATGEKLNAKAFSKNINVK